MKTLRVLIVEDHRDTAATLAQWVTAAGHDAKVCHTGFQAEQALPSYRPDVVLLDIGLPDMDGWELAPLLRRENASLTVVAVTAYQSSEDRRKSKDAGIDLHLGKPVHRKNVLRLLDTAAAG
ncbi:MAG TPA: response regulator [Pirellulales bacterium]|jgi:DNA-binding response OmpR family regulator|nr:response regulator [Pirellulales bacterium]